MEKNIKIEASGDFPFQFFIEKALPSEENGEMIIEGVASTVNIDHDNERMSPSALASMAEVINAKSVPLRIEHQHDNNAVVGNVFKAWIDERNQLWIKAMLDKAHPASGILYKSLKDGVKLGLSVGGVVKNAVKEMSEATGKMVKTFYQVMLNEVSVTQRPANYDSWLLAKSIAKDKENIEQFYETPFYKEFLFETSGYDYLQSFAKSIPDKSWKRVELIDNNINKDMKKKEGEEKETETKEKAESTETETKEKAESSETETKEKAEESETTTKSFQEYMTKAMESLTNIVTGLVTKSSEKDTEETTIMEDKTKAQDSTDESEKEKAESSETETKEKAESSDSEETPMKEKNGDAYKMKSILDRLDNLKKAMDTSETETKEKAEDKESETTEKSASIDSFADVLEKHIEALEDKFAKSGRSVYGLRSMLLDLVKNDPEIQKEISSMSKEAGFKKSISNGTPFIRSKTGQVYEIVAKEVGGTTIEKSAKAETDFKTMYKTQLSSVAQAEQQ